LGNDLQRHPYQPQLAQLPHRRSDFTTSGRPVDVQVFDFARGACAERVDFP
jgi:hypothetical protein